MAHFFQQTIAYIILNQWYSFDAWNVP